MNASAHPTMEGAARLTDRCVFRLTGDDRARYLNGQVTQDMVRLNPGETRHACVTNAKGRMEAEVFITALPDALLIDAPAEVRDSLALRLERYIIADDVELHDETGDWEISHLLGVDPSTLDLTNGTLVTANERFGVPGFDVFHRNVEPALAALAQLEPSALEDLRIRQGVAVWGRELGIDTLPPEAGLETRSISYTKGCYIGQEVISRMRSAGKVNRRLARFELSSELPEDLSGALLWSDDSTFGRPAGTLTSWTQRDGTSPRMGLGYVMRRAEDMRQFAVHLTDGTLIEHAARR